MELHLHREKTLYSKYREVPLIAILLISIGGIFALKIRFFKKNYSDFSIDPEMTETGWFFNQ